MANAVSKIERLGLSERVSSLMVDDGITVGREIGRILRKEGHHVSDAAVNRYLSKVGRVAKSRADKIIQDHVDKVVPDDLVALERVESVSLKWFNEEPSEMADRLAAVHTAVDWEVDSWEKMIAAAKEEAGNSAARAKIIKNIIKTCLEYILKDERLQDKRLKAAAMAVKVIELKLAKSGLLKDDGRGKIVIVDRSDEYDSDPDAAQKKKVKPLILQFSKPGTDKDGADG